MLLAVEDVNRAGGVNNRPLRLVSRASNSGTTRGLNALLSVLYEARARYLIGPEENSLANEIASDVRALDVLNILPGDSAPGVGRVSRTGAWMRLASGALPLGCSYAELAQWKVTEARIARCSAVARRRIVEHNNATHSDSHDTSESRHIRDCSPAPVVTPNPRKKNNEAATAA